MDADKIKLEKSWKDVLNDEFQGSYLAQLYSFLENEYCSGKKIYPPRAEIFAALNITPFDKVKVVLIGQDPYHGTGQAHGLCFSVRKDVKLPPSLQNIFEELHREFPHFREPRSGDLSKWAEQGVLLLNRSLTVEEGNPGSHQRKWKCFTNKIIEKLAAKNNLVFIAWGKEAQKPIAKIDKGKHKVLESAHPSPLSCRLGFLGNNHFKKANNYLRKTKQKPINWQL